MTDSVYWFRPAIWLSPSSAGCARRDCGTWSAWPGARPPASVGTDSAAHHGGLGSAAQRKPTLLAELDGSLPYRAETRYRLQ